jgi:hypothetical protein
MYRCDETAENFYMRSPFAAYFPDPARKNPHFSVPFGKNGNHPVGFAEVFTLDDDAFSN